MSSLQHFKNEYLLSPSIELSPIATSASHCVPSPISGNRNDELARSPMPISNEFDLISEGFVDIEDGSVDRSDWLQRAMDEHPEIKSFREKVLPIQRAAKFADLYLPPKRLISHDVLLSLISQHLRTLGLVKTQTSLHSEWDGELKIPAHLNKSQLNYLIQRGILRAERFWELENDPPASKRILDEEISKIIGGLPVHNDNEQSFESEIPFDPKNMKIDNGIVRGASLNNLILLMTSEHKYDIPNLVDAFCSAYDSIVSSRILFDKIKERFETSFKNNKFEDAQKTFKLLKKWTRLNRDEIEQSIQDEIKQYAEKRLKPYFNDKIFKLFVKRSQKFNYSNTFQVTLGKCNRFWTGKFQIFEIPPDEIARQLTYITSSTFYEIQEKELQNSAWETPRLAHRAPNILTLIARTNNIPKIVASQILTEKKFEKRIQIMTYFIQVMRALKELRNYSDYFDFYTAFTEPSILRMTVHLSMLNTKDKEFLNSFEPYFDLDHGHQMKKELMSTLEYNKYPCLPNYIYYLREIGQFNEQKPSKIDGIINIMKFTFIYSKIQELFNFKKIRYSILPIDQIQVKLLDYPILDDNTLIMLSNRNEPDNSTEEDLRMNDSQ